MSNKASLHKGKLGSEKHNQRDFDFKRLSDHIDPDKTYLNTYVSFCPGEGREIDFYNERYTKALDLQNEKYARKRNYDRIRTIEEVYNNKQKCPTEEIIQYSDHGGVAIPKERFDLIVKTYVEILQKWSAAHGDHFHILKYAIHYDETVYGSAHCHIRTIWDYVDADGNIAIGQERGMEQAGLNVSDPQKLEDDLIRAEIHKVNAESYVSEWDIRKDKSGSIIKKLPISFSDKEKYDIEMKKYNDLRNDAKRHNNRNITWTKLQRKIWEAVLEGFGYQVDRNRNPGKKHKTKEEYHALMQREEKKLIEEREKYEHLIEQEEQIIDERVKTIYSAVYDDVKDAALKSAKIEADNLMAEVNKEITKAKMEAEAINGQIDDNRRVLELIRKRERIIEEQNRKIEANNRLIRNQENIKEILGKGNTIIDLTGLDEITKFM